MAFEREDRGCSAVVKLLVFYFSSFDRGHAVAASFSGPCRQPQRHCEDGGRCTDGIRPAAASLNTVVSRIMVRFSKPFLFAASVPYVATLPLYSEQNWF